MTPTLADLVQRGANSYARWYWRRDAFTAPEWVPALVMGYRSATGEEFVSVLSWGWEDAEMIGQTEAEYMPMVVP